MTFNGKILIVDDEPHVRLYVSMILRSLGFPNCIEAANGLEALECYEREKPDLVLLDINMPVLDGFETLKKIRTINKEAIVIMLTSLANRHSVEESAQLGAVYYLRKDTPRLVIINELREILESAFDTDIPAPTPAP